MTQPRPTQHAHEPVMLDEAFEFLAPRPGARFIDATVGLGGHAEALLEAAQPGGRLLGIDLDPGALAHGFPRVDGVLFDLGVSSLQLDASGRGFSFQRDEPLDMRMDPEAPDTAASIVNTYSERELADLIYRYGEERRSRQIARAIVARRPLRTTGDLVNAIEQAVGRGRERRIHPATQTFQALRIATNRELDFLGQSLSAACGLLAGVGARLVVIAFHSLEDRIVKDFLRRESTDCVCPPGTPICVCGHTATLRLLTRRVRRPGEAELARNPRARSARLRAAELIVERAA